MSPRNASFDVWCYACYSQGFRYSLVRELSANKGRIHIHEVRYFKNASPGLAMLTQSCVQHTLYCVLIPPIKSCNNKAAVKY